MRFAIFQQFDGHLVICLGSVFFKGNVAVEQAEAALDVFEAQARGAFVELFEIGLGEAAAVVVQADEKPVAGGVLGHVDEAGITVLQDIIHQLLDDAEEDQLIFGLEPFAVVVKAAAGVDAARAAYFLEQVVDSRFETEVFEGRRHQAVRDIADELDGIVDDLLGVVDALQLGGLVEVDQVFVEIEPCRGEQGPCIVVQVGREALAFLFLEADRGVEEHALLFLLHSLEGLLVADDLALVENNEYDEPYGQREHTDGSEEHNRRDAGLGINLQEQHLCIL